MIIQHQLMNPSCKELVVEASFNADDLATDADWQQQFLNMCQNVCDWTPDNTKRFTRCLTAHIGGLDLYLMPIPNLEQLVNYKRCYFWDNQQLVYIGFNGDTCNAQNIPIENRELFLSIIQLKQSDAATTFLHFSAEEVSSLRSAFHSLTDIGHISIYRSVQDLINNLKIIHARLTNNLGENFSVITDTDRATIIAPLAEDLSGCSEGLHNRTVNMVRQFVLPQTLATILMRVRINIVDEIARGLSSDIHVHTFAHTLAHHAGFGVPIVNINDQQVRNSTSIVQAIQTKLQNHDVAIYRPFYIISQIAVQINMAVMKYEYDGLKSEGYTKNSYEQFINYLKLILGDRVDYSCLVMDDDTYIVTDINWMRVKTLIWARLIEEEFFILSPYWVALLKTDELNTPLRMINDAVCLETENDIYYLQCLFEHPCDFIQFLKCFTELDIRKKNDILTTFIDAYLDDHHGDNYEMVGPLLDEITPYIIAFPNGYTATPLIKLCCTALMDAICSSRNKLILQKIRKLPILLQLQIFMQSIELEFDSVFLSAITTYSPMLQDLMNAFTDISRMLDDNCLYSLLTQCNERGMNGFMLVAAEYPEQLESVINFMSTINTNIQGQLLTQVDLYERNFLLSILEYPTHPKPVLTELWPIISNLDINFLIIMLRQKNHNRQTVLELASDDTPTCIILHILLLQAILDEIKSEAYTYRVISKADQERINLICNELLDLVADEAGIFLKVTFKRFAEIILNLPPKDNNTSTFFSPTINNLFESLNYFGESLTGFATGGYINSEMLIEDLTANATDAICSTPPSKRSRIEPS